MFLARRDFHAGSFTEWQLADVISQFGGIADAACTGVRE
jgi:hypothetical protein